MSAPLTLVLVHGFMDDAHVWAPFERHLTSDVATVAAHLAGLGTRAREPGPFTLGRFADDVVALVDDVDGPVVVVGQSMGTQIAELVGVRRRDVVRTLVLISPIPLAGTHLPAEFAADMKLSTQRSRDDQRAGRLSLGPGFPLDELDRLIDVAASVPAETVSDILDAWDHGHPDGLEPSRFGGPVLVLHGEVDGFSTPHLVATGVTPRFSDAEVVEVPNAGHWAHTERPAFVAASVDQFLAARLGS